MNILFFEYNNYCKEDICKAFQALSHSVTIVTNEDVHSRKSKVIDDLFEQEILKQNYDFVFTFNYSPVISSNCNKVGIKYVSWVYDSPYVMLYSITVINPCNYIFIFDKALYWSFKKEGIETVYYLPLAVNTQRLDNMIINDKIKGIFNSDISFIGSMYNEKNNLYERMEDKLSAYTKGYLEGIMAAQLQIYGYFFVEKLLGTVIEDMKKAMPYEPANDGVENPEYVYANYFIGRKLAQLERLNILAKVSKSFGTKLYTYHETPMLPKIKNMGPANYMEEMPYIFKCSKINLNLSLRSIQSGIPLRAFDIMGAGGFLLTNYQADFLDYFVPDEDFVFFESEEDLISKCNYYLTHEEERIRIAQSGYRKVKEFHSYEVRIGEMLRIVF